TCLSDYFEPVLALLAEILRAPSLPDEEIRTRKGEVITAIRQDEDNPAVRATEGLMARLYPDGHPYGRRTKGTVEIVEQLTGADLIRQHQHRFAPSELIAIIVGDVPVDRAQHLAAAVFGTWTQPAPLPLAIPPAGHRSSRERIVIPMMNKSQADVAYG